MEDYVDQLLLPESEDGWSVSGVEEQRHDLTIIVQKGRALEYPSSRTVLIYIEEDVMLRRRKPQQRIGSKLRQLESDDAAIS